MSLREEIIDLITAAVANAPRAELFRQPLVGFSAADDPLYLQLQEFVGPWHMQPQDILPQAKTIISFFLPFSAQVVTSNRGGDRPSHLWAESYVEANKLINHICDEIIALLTKKGIDAATVRATHTYDESTLQAGWSHRSAARIAGLGRFGVNRMLITPVGCAGRYGSVLIGEETAPDPHVDEEYCLYYQDGSCLVCLSACPVDALGVDSFDRFTCHDRLLENAKAFVSIGKCDVCGKCVVAGPCALME